MTQRHEIVVSDEERQAAIDQRERIARLYRRDATRVCQCGEYARCQECLSGQHAAAEGRA